MNTGPAAPKLDDPPSRAAAGWHARLQLHARLDNTRTVVHDRHHGPLRVLKSLYPEGPGICHQVLVHPPGGFVGGDRIEIEVQVQPYAHLLLTTAGASRFYRSGGIAAEQDASVHIGAHSRVEWLPLESIAYDGCIARNRLRFRLDDGAELLGWDLLALGLPAAAQPFGSGRFEQHLEWPGVWLERGRIDADDHRLRHSPLGLGGHCVIATLWFAAGSPLAEARRESLLEAARASASAESVVSATTAPNSRVVVLRALAPQVEPAVALLRGVWAAWRRAAWGLVGDAPRVWRT